jgi:hypothetical protein
VKILEHDDERPLSSERLQEPAPRDERLGAFALCARKPDEGRELAAEPLVLVRVGGLERDGELAGGFSGLSDSRIPAWAFTISPRAQNVIPSP